MNEQTSLPPATPDWYPDHAAGVLRWWDGSTWTGYTQPLLPERWPSYAGPVTLAPSRAVLPAGFARLGKAVQVLLALSGVSAAVHAGFTAWTAIAMLAGQAAIVPLEPYGPFTVSVSGVTSLLGLATGITWVVWQHRLATSIPRAGLRRSPGWHIASWLIPVISLWFPYQNMSDIRRALTPTARAARHVPTLLAAWWATYIGSQLVAGVASVVELVSAPTAQALVPVAVTMAIAGLIEAAAAALAVLVVGDLTRAAITSETAESEDLR